jgi:hypothetical protein
MKKISSTGEKLRNSLRRRFFTRKTVDLLLPVTHWIVSGHEAFQDIGRLAEDVLIYG